MNKYREMKERNQKEVNNFPIQFAFSDEQFKEGMEKLGLTENDIDKVVPTVGGGFIRKTDVKAYKEMINRQYNERKEAINNDLTGEGFIYDMFKEELANHEYGYTYELDDTLDSLGFTIDDINNNPNLKHGLELATKAYKERSFKEEEEDELESEQ